MYTVVRIGCKLCVRSQVFVKWERERVDLTSYNVTTQYVAHSDCTTEGASVLISCELRAELYLEPDADGEGIHVAAASGVDEVGSARGAEHGGVEGVVEHPEGPGRRGHLRDEKKY